MKIRDMFQEDIDRKINGVVKVDQEGDDVLVQELNEYVVTKELKKHFITFFNNYGDSFKESTSDMGVWISGFFGSGKSHLLKMLSYLLENREVQGIRTVERFRKKFDDDPATFMLIDAATGGETDTILFNIDIEGSIHKGETAVLRVFAKMFYNYLGFHGEDLKVAKLEQFIAKQGKTEEFRRAFAEKHGKEWLDSRSAYVFLEDPIVAALQEALGMSKEAAVNWFNGPDAVETSIAQLVSEIKEYVDGKPENFRLLFMADEVGQYVGGNTGLLLNLQSLVEKLGSECSGKVWVVCTGQEAIDEIIKARENEFSRIQARFKTRLSLSSSSADEVIQKRILQKKPDVVTILEQLYTANEAVLRNLFSFSGSVLDIKGYRGPADFARDFPFVPYQFILMQKVFAEIRKHGNIGKHLSGGERSMLSGFQEAAQKVEEGDEYVLAPFYLFYNTVHGFLDGSIRRVIERCERAAADGAGVEPQDADVLKLLYLVRYVDDVKANLDNIVILMAGNIRMDKIAMREQVKASLDRLLSQNYIGRSGDAYNFLTDEEQDVQREIKNTLADASAIVGRIAEIVFEDIYQSKKFRYVRNNCKYDFPFDQKVDDAPFGTPSGGMGLRVMTIAADAAEKTELRLASESVGQAIVVLGDAAYYDSLENALRIRNYVKQRNLQQLPASVQEIIRRHQEEASRCEKSAKEELKKAIETGRFYAAGERLDIKPGDAKGMIDQALEYLVAHMYNDLELIVKNAESDADILAILKGADQALPGMELNREAAAKVEEYLEMRANQKLPTSMADVQSRYQAAPYGWKEIDVAATVALLIHDQKAAIRYGGEIIQPDNAKLPDMLRKKSETAKTSISKRQAVSLQNIRAVKDFLRDYFNEMGIPEDEDGLVAYIEEKFEDELRRYQDMLARYERRRYPDRDLVAQAVALAQDILSQRRDNTALIKRILNKEDTLYISKEALQPLEDFFKTQAPLFDDAVKCEEALRDDLDYLSKDEGAKGALEQIRQIIAVPPAGESFDYKRIPQLNELMAKVRASHEAMLKEKRDDLLEIVRQCMAEVHQAAGRDASAKNISDRADGFFAQKREQIAATHGLRLLDGLLPQIYDRKDKALDDINTVLKPKQEPVAPASPPTEGQAPVQAAKKKFIKPLYRQVLFPARTLSTDAEIDAYVEEIRLKMKQSLKDCDGIKLS